KADREARALWLFKVDRGTRRACGVFVQSGWYSDLSRDGDAVSGAGVWHPSLDSSAAWDRWIVVDHLERRRWCDRIGIYRARKYAGCRENHSSGGARAAPRRRSVHE